jgi:hypothetical protein
MRSGPFCSTYAFHQDNEKCISIDELLAFYEISKDDAHLVESVNCLENKSCTEFMDKFIDKIEGEPKNK